MVFKVVTSEDAEEQLYEALDYIRNVLCNEFAAINVYVDYLNTTRSLRLFPRAHRKCDGEALKDYHRVNLRKHRYFLLYRVENDTVYIERFYHASQDYERLMG